jgi:outer membrane immunogenic protein
MHAKESTMKKLLLANIAISVLGAGGTALAADMPVKAPPVAAPPPFTWTGCYLGAHLGGGWARKDITDPVQLVQDSFSGAPLTTGVTTASASPSGVVVGGQFGCDYQFASNWVAGIEGAASGSNMSDSKTVALPLGVPGEQARVTARTDFIPSVTARLGYAMDRLLLYARGGASWAGDKYTVTGTFLGTGFGFEGLDARSGWTAGGGVDWAFWGNWSASLEYDYYQFGHGTVRMSDSTNVLSGLVDAKQSVQAVKFGLNFHMWGTK